MSLHSEMAELDGAGRSYWLQNVEVGDGTEYPSLDVIEHDGVWMHVLEPEKSEEESIWIYMGYVRRAQLVVVADKALT